MTVADPLILAVDDHDSTLEIVSSVLQSLGHDLVVGHTAAQMWEAIAAQPPDLILVNLGVAGDTGLDVCRELCTNAALRSLPLLVLGTVQQRPQWLQALALGAADQITLPCDRQELQVKIQTQLELKQLRAIQAQHATAQQELNQALGAIEEITLNRRRLLATISHDIRTPLHGTLGMLKLLESSGLSAQQQVQLSLAQSSAESLLTLINDLLDLSSAEMGYLGLHRAPFNLYTCLDECIRPFALVAEEKGLNFILDLSGVADPEVEGDAKRLRQILAQLLSNALKFTEQGEILVQINLYELAGTLRLEGKVTDTGVGIPVDRLDSLFGHALLPPTSTRLAPHPDLTQPSPAFASSLDFGLSLVKRLCVLMGGDVQVDSAVGKGSCFTFSLNLQPIYPKPAPFHPLGLAGASLLVVVPNLTQRLVLQHQLEAWGLTVVSVGSGAQALQATPPPDAVTFDVVLMAATVLDELGWDWMQQLPAETGLAHVPWVLLKPMHR
ncbi:MAG: ATP-binding protein, partial [Prochlorothrix sp.]